MTPILELVETPLSVDDVLARVADPGCGAFVSFSGTVRNEHHGRSVEKLEYSAYPPMVITQMAEIAREAAERWTIEKLAIVHRVGTLELGETSIVIVLGMPHRKESFAALQFCIDRFKEIVPIWKKEFFSDGEAVWVEGS